MVSKTYTLIRGRKKMLTVVLCLVCVWMAVASLLERFRETPLAFSFHWKYFNTLRTVDSCGLAFSSLCFKLLYIHCHRIICSIYFILYANPSRHISYFCFNQVPKESINRGTYLACYYLLYAPTL